MKHTLSWFDSEDRQGQARLPAGAHLHAVERRRVHRAESARVLMRDADVHRLAPFAHVADLERTISFYTLLGFKPVSIAKGDDGKPYWAHVKSGTGSLLFSLADAPISHTEQGIMFYMYCEDVAGLRVRLLEAGAQVSDVSHPPYMPEGEIRVQDPDAYTLC